MESRYTTGPLSLLCLKVPQVSGDVSGCIDHLLSGRSGNYGIAEQAGSSAQRESQSPRSLFGGRA